MDSAHNVILSYAPDGAPPAYPARRLRLRVACYTALAGALMALAAPVRVIGMVLFGVATSWYLADFAVGVWKENLR